MIAPLGHKVVTLEKVLEELAINVAQIRTDLTNSSTEAFRQLEVHRQAIEAIEAEVQALQISVGIVQNPGVVPQID
jgi:hypothetical protein